LKQLSLSAVETGDFARRLAIDGALLQIGPLVMRKLPMPHAKLGFYPSIFPIELEDNKAAAFDLRFTIELVDLLPMQQQFADALCRRDFVAGFFVWLDIGVVKKGFAIFDSRERIADVRLACPDRFDFAPLQFDARFVSLKNPIIAERFAIDNRLSRHVQTPQAECAADSARYNASWKQMLGSVRRFFERFVSQLAGNNFLERNVGQRHPRGGLH
jgi:hypothetical protein